MNIKYFSKTRILYGNGSNYVLLRLNDDLLDNIFIQTSFVLEFTLNLISDLVNK